MLKLLRYFQPYRWSLLLLIALVIGQVSTTLALPDYTARIIDEGVVGLNQPSILRNGGIMLLVSLLGGVCMVAAGYLAARIATGFTMRIREDLFRQVESFSLLEFNRFSTASLITRCTNDLQQVQMVMVLLLRLAFMAPIMGVWAIAKAYRLAPGMTWIVAVAIGLLIVIVGVLFGIALPRFARLQALVDQLNLVSREILTGLRVIRAFNKEAHEEQKFSAVNTDLMGVNLFVNRLLALMQPAMILILNLTSVAIVWVGASQIASGDLQIGDLLAYLQYAMQAIFAFLMISFIFVMAPRAAISADRVVEVLETVSTIHDPAQPIASAAEGRGSLVFDHVTFTYPGAEAPVLQDVSFTANPGETTAIIGSTGSGKSSLLNLIPRLYDVTAGRILVDGVDVRDMRLDDLYRKIGYVPQKATLFSGTVASNLRYGSPERSDDELARSAAIAQAAAFVEELEAGYEQPVAQGGANFSGGQKQRLAIARAIARDPDILIFDDSFSALDFRTEARLRAALREVAQQRTVLVVAQRVSTIMQADTIIVLDSGRVVCQGTHEELMRACPLYQEIASSQLSDDELGHQAAPGSGEEQVIG
ncbi:MAG: ABC transporter ATP-binding protein [Thermomicrobiales bacterium]